MIDPVSAFGLAANLAQFIDFTFKLLSESKEIYRSASGSSKETVDLESTSTVLKELSERLSSSSLPSEQPLSKRSLALPSALHDNRQGDPSGRRRCPPDALVSDCSKQEAALKQMAEACQAVANEILSGIQAVNASDTNRKRKWESFRHAIKTQWSSKRLETLQRKMNDLRSQMTLQVSEIILLQQMRITELLDNCRQMDTGRTDRGSELKDIADSLKRSVNLLEAKEHTMGRIGVDLNKAHASATRISWENAILNSLYFDAMEDRYSRITTAHQATFDWILHPDPTESSSNPTDVGLVDWLQSKHGVYWISGKPGSGKSTLMKFLIDHHQTQKRLLRWSGSRMLTTARFYFWNAGSDLQKSQEGLLRSLLYEILRKCPSIISFIYKQETSCTDHMRWTLQDLLKAMHAVRDYGTLGTKFCFFIDGLDEYDGNHHEIIAALKALISSPNIKLYAFGRDPSRKLYLHNLTRTDIEVFTRNAFQENDVFYSLSSAEKLQAEGLVDQVVSKSHGVFLWVFLVVRSLNEGLTNGDSISTLQERFRLIPADLEQFFLHILHQVEPIYRSRMAYTFQQALQAGAPMPVLAYSFLDENDPDFAISPDCRELDKESMKARNQKVARRLNGRCKGLLEVHRSWHWPEFWGNKVEFIHRTARDYLLSKEMQSFLQSQCDTKLKTYKQLSRAYLCLIRTLPSSGMELLRSHIDKCMYFAYNAEIEQGISDCAMLEKLEQVVRERCSQDATIVASGLDATADDWMLNLAVTNGLHIYVKEWLAQHPSLGPVVKDRDLNDWM